MNSHSIRKISGFAAMVGVLCVAGACGDLDGVDDGMGEVQVTFQEATAEALFQVVTADLANSPASAAGRVDRDLVESLNVTVTSIGLLSHCEDAGNHEGDGQCEGPWEKLVLDGFELEVDLLALPTEDGTSEPLAVGLIPVGVYHKVRLLISEATITFADTITVGNSTFLPYDADNPETVYTVEIPSGHSTGIKADIDLEVTDDNIDDVGLLFDPEATFRSVVATGNGRVLLPPVFKARAMRRHQNQNQNQNQGS